MQLLFLMQWRRSFCSEFELFSHQLLFDISKTCSTVFEQRLNTIFPALWFATQSLFSLSNFCEVDAYEESHLRLWVTSHDRENSRIWGYSSPFVGLSWRNVINHSEAGNLIVKGPWNESLLTFVLFCNKYKWASFVCILKDHQLSISFLKNLATQPKEYISSLYVSHLCLLFSTDSFLLMILSAG